jgi:gliding motility-associated-like protein
VFVRAEKATEPTCFAIVDFNLVVNPAVNFDISIPSVVSVCDGDPFPELDATPQNPNIDLNFVSYTWADAQGNVVSTDPMYMPMAEGGYSVTVALEPCDATTIGFVAVRYEQPMFDLGGDTCAGPDTILDATPDNYASDDVTFVWLLDGEQIAGADQATYNPTTAGNFTAIVSVGDCAGEQTVVVGPELDLMVTEECLPDAGSLKQTLVANTNSNVGSFQWRENGEVVGTGSTYIIDWGTQTGSNDPRTFTVTLSEDDCSNSQSITVTQFNCVIPQGISPNSDDLNDCFDLEFIADRFGAFSVDIYNRYGMNVFSQDNYINEFCGVDQDGSDLITGTYYYVIKFAESNEEYGEMVTGWVYVNQSAN